jgi:hypothetical protein
LANCSALAGGGAAENTARAAVAAIARRFAHPTDDFMRIPAIF